MSIDFAKAASILKQRKKQYVGAKGLVTIGETWRALLQDAWGHRVPTITGQTVALMHAAIKLHRAVRPGHASDDYIDAVNYLELASDFSDGSTPDNNEVTHGVALRDFLAPVKDECESVAGGVIPEPGKMPPGAHAAEQHVTCILAAIAKQPRYLELLDQNVNAHAIARLFCLLIRYANYFAKDFDHRGQVRVTDLHTDQKALEEATQLLERVAECDTWGCGPLGDDVKTFLQAEKERD